MKKIAYTITLSILLVNSSPVLAQLSIENNDINSISEKYLSWVLGSKDIDYKNPLIKIRYESILNYVNNADKIYNNHKFDINNTFNLTVKSGQSEPRKILSKILFPLCLGYQLPGDTTIKNPYYKNPITLNKINFLFDYLKKKGWKKGLDMGYHYLDSYEKTGIIGYGGSMGNNLLPYGLSVFLMKKELTENKLLNEKLEMLDWVSNTVGLKYDFPVLWQETGYNCDGVRSMFNVRLCYILSLPENHPNRLHEMIFLSKLLDKSLQISNGWADLIKSDYLGYHHKGAYLNAYAPDAFHTASLMIYLLEGSAFQVSKKAIDNLSKAILTTRIYSNKYDIPRGLSGRFPTYLTILQNHLPSFLYVANNKNPVQHELKSAFMRLWDPTNKNFNTAFLKQVECQIMYHGSVGAIEHTLNALEENITPEISPNGYWYFPSGGLTIYRQNDWMASWKGISKYIWDFEIGNQQNLFGRFASAGTLRIYASGNPISAIESGYGVKGWNWANLPGATTFDLPAEKLKSKTMRHFSPESFLGGVNLNGKYGVSGLNYNDPLGKLKANKTVFFFEDYIVCLGSDIFGQNNKANVQTTLTQLSLENRNVRTLFGKKNIKGFNSKIVCSNKYPISYIDAKRHAYYILSKDTILFERKKQTNPLHDGKKLAKGNFETCRIIHGTNPQGSNYQYAIQVNGGNKGAKNLAKNFDKLFKIQRNDSVAHIASYLPQHITGYAIRKANIILGDTLLLSSNKPCLVMLKNKQKGRISLSISNPELGKIDQGLDYYKIKTRALWHAKSTKKPVELTLKGYWDLTETNSKISVEINKNEKITVITFDCFDSKTIEAKLVEN